MKQLKRRIKLTILTLFMCLICVVSFSKIGMLFNEDEDKFIYVKATNKDLDTSRYSASIENPVKKEPEPIKKDVNEETSNLQYNNETIQVISNKLNKKFAGSLTGKGELMARLSIEKGMDPYLLAAISVHETAYGKSSAARNKFNFGGIMCSGRLCSYPSADEGITSFVNMVYRNYFSRGLTTPEQMNKRYAASTSWASKVHAHYNALKNE